MNPNRIISDLSPHTERPSFVEYTDVYGHIFAGITKKILVTPDMAKKIANIDILFEWILFAKVIWEYRQKRYVLDSPTPFSANRLVSFQVVHSERIPTRNQERLLLKCLDPRETLELWQHEYDI
jgi:hypothetical protein